MIQFRSDCDVFKLRYTFNEAIVAEVITNRTKFFSTVLYNKP